jgi:4-amino-4-deoxy-L-arabinose transferase-like glycosyltransferase
MPKTPLTRSEHLRALWPWLPLWTAAAMAAMFLHGPMPMYSTRTLAVAWEMWAGHHWLVPTINGMPYSHKVPLLYWLIHAGWFVGGVGDVWPRLLEVLLGATQLLMVATLARRLFPERPWVARITPWLLMALSYAFLFGLQIMYEVLLAVCVLGALLALTPRGTRESPRWLWFALWIGAGLLSKGPVMLLHAAFPWLLGPLWSEYARRHRGRWYGRGALALLGGVAILVAWVIPAIHLGGPRYEQMLLFKQTTGRVVDAFDHAHPVWWYLPWIPVILFPFSALPRVWVALASLRRPLEPGVRFLLAWLVPVLLAFSLISGKQTYYPLPEYGGMVMLLAAAIVLLRERRPHLARTAWLGPWPMALGGFAFGALLLALPDLLGHGPFRSHWFVDIARYSRFFGVVYVLLGGLLLWRGRGELRRIAVAGLVGTFCANLLFTLSLWQNFNVRPAVSVIGPAAHAGRAIGNIGNYEGQYQFEGRITRSIESLYTPSEVQRFARAHPEGLLIDYPSHLKPDDLRYARLVQPFRGKWMVIWRAGTLSTLRSGGRPPEPDHPTQLYPSPDYWRYRNVP